MAAQRRQQRALTDLMPIGEWMAVRNRLGDLSRRAELAGREAWAKSEKLVARRPSHVVETGRNVLREVGSASKAARQTLHENSRVVGKQLGAGARGAWDSFTFDLGDKASSGVGALLDASRGGDLRRSYQQRLATEDARDAEDARRYPVARTVGQVLGTGAQIALLGAAEAGVAGGVRLAQAAPLVAREAATLAGGGAALGVGAQVHDDMGQGRPGTTGDYVGAALGGAAAGLMARHGSGTAAGSTAGAVTSVSQDLLNGRPISLDQARRDALAGGAGGGVAGAWGRRAVDQMSFRDKGILGEGLSKVRSAVRGQASSPGPKRAQILSDGRRTIPDDRTYRNGVLQDIVEAKFGRRPRLSKGQLRAYEELGNYRVDHFMPQDVGVALGLPSAFGLIQEGGEIGW